MYKDNSDRPFYQLFSQLDATEKKFFRRYLEHLPGDQQKKYQLPLKVKSEIPRNAERYLFDHLLRFLRSFRAVSPRVEIMHHVTNAENLFLHQFPHLALQEIYKAEGICKQYEFLEEEFVVLSWKQKLRANLLLFEDAETTAHDLLENIKKSNALYIQNLLNNEINTLWDSFDNLPLKAFTEVLEHKVRPMQETASTTREGIVNAMLMGKTNLILGSLESAKNDLLAAWQLINSNHAIRLSNPLLTLEIADWLAQYALVAQDQQLLILTAKDLERMHFISPNNDARRLASWARMQLKLKTTIQDIVGLEKLIGQDLELFIIGALSDKAEKRIGKNIRYLNQVLNSKTTFGFALTRKLLRLEILLHQQQGNDMYCRSRLRSYLRKYENNLNYNPEERLELELLTRKINGQAIPLFKPTNRHLLYFGFSVLDNG
jgi:hypothetical protein